MMKRVSKFDNYLKRVSKFDDFFFDFSDDFDIITDSGYILRIQELLIFDLQKNLIDGEEVRQRVGES